MSLSILISTSSSSSQIVNSKHDTALYNFLLLTIRDAARVPGPKQIVVFSNGADDTNLVSADDVRRVAENEGIPVSVVSINMKDEISNATWSRITNTTGGGVFLAADWAEQRRAVQALGDMVRNTYVLSYYTSNDKPGFRKLQVRVKGGDSYAIRCRSGYHPQAPVRVRREGLMVAGGSPRSE